MKRCLELAEKGKGYTAPNPMVGAVLVHEGRIIGEGWHRQYGEAHAEVNCFESVALEHKHLIPASVLYVSLEPCAHYGKTPPCAERIVREGVKEVVIANTDPFPQVAGKGVDILLKHGIAVRTGCMEAEGRWLNRRFFFFHEQQRPYIILKWAQSADGFLAPADRSRLQLSNKYSAILSHSWRVQEAAIMVGYNTALYDNPQLTSRHWTGRQPLRIALDRNLSLPATHHLANNETDTWIINELKEGMAVNTRYVKLPFDKELLPALLERLYQEKYLSLLVEGGTALHNSFIEAGLWDEARLIKTPVVLNEGIVAPVLKNVLPVFDTMIKEDQLFIYKHNHL